MLNVINFPAMAYIVRRQGDVNFGQWQTAMTLTTTLAVLAHVGLRPYFVRAMAQDHASVGRRLAEQLALRMSLALVAGALAVGSCLALGYSKTVLACTAVGSVGILFSALSECFADVLEALERFLAYTNSIFVGGLLLTAASVLVCYWGGGPVALAMSYLILPAFNALAMGSVVQKIAPIRLHFDVARWKELLFECRLAARAVFFGSFEERAETLVLPKVSGYADNGIFAAGSIPASRLISIPSGLSSFYFPRLARRQAQGRDLNETIMHMLTLLLLFTLPAALGVRFLSDWVSTILFPDSPELCAKVMALTAWSLPVTGFWFGFTVALQATGRIDQAARAELRTILIGFGATIVLVIQFGVMGAVMSYLVRAGLSVTLLLPLCWGPFHRAILSMPWLKIGLAAAAMEAVFQVSHALHLGLAATLVGGAVGGTLAYAAVLAVTGILTPHRLKVMLSGGGDD